MTPNFNSSSEASFSESETEENSENVELICQSCLVVFKNRKIHKEHRCIFCPDYSFFKTQNITPVILSLPRSSEKTSAILSQLCSEDIVEMCRLQH